MKRVLFLVLTLAAASCSGRTVALTSFAPTCAAVTDYALEVSKNSGGRITSRTACSVTWQLDDGED